MRNRSARYGTTGSQSPESPSPPCRSSTASPLPASSYQRRPPLTSTTPTSRRYSLRRHGLRARAGGRSGPDGRRDCADRRRLRPPRLDLRLLPRRDGARARHDAQEPREARGEGRRRPGRDPRARHAGGGDRPCRADDRGGRRGSRYEGGGLPSGGRDTPCACGPRLEHVLDPDHLARIRHRPAGPRDRYALLQPRAGAEARRDRAWPRDLRRDGGLDRRARRGARQDTGRGQRLPRLRVQPDPDAVHQRGRLGAPRRRRRGGGDRHDREARLRPPDRAARARRPDRAGHVRRDHGGAAGGARRPEVRAVSAAARARPGRPPWPQVGPRFLRLRLMDFELSPEQREIQALTRDFVRAEVEPYAADWDREHHFPRDVFANLGEIGLMGVCVPEEYGGAGADFVSYVLVLEELSRADAGVGVTVAVHTSAVALPILAWGTDEQKARFVPPLARGELLGAFALTEPEAGSDAGSLRTSATPDDGGWHIDGSKRFISTARYAGTFLFFARTDPGTQDAGGVSAFVLDAEHVRVTRDEEKLGLNSTTTSDIVVDSHVDADRLLGDKGKGFAIAMSTLDGGRIGIAAQAVGIAQAAFEAARAYALERKQFGKLIGEQQAIQHKLANMSMEIDAARLLVLRAAWLKQHGRPHAEEGAKAKLFAFFFNDTATTE